MIDFKITFQDNEPLYGYCEKISPISKIVFRNFLRQFEIKTAKFKHSFLPRKRISRYGFGILIVSTSSSISSVLFYYNRGNVSNFMLF